MNCGALLLAAGRSTRMGAHKLLEHWQGKPLVVHAADALLNAGLPLLVVLGHEASAVRSVLARRDVSFVQAADYAKGLAHSLRAGLAAVPDDWDAVLVALGDMPRIEPELLARLAAADGVAVPIFDGRRGNPVRWPRAHFPALMALEGDQGARRLLAGQKVTEVIAPSDAVLTDIDTPEALAALRRHT
ncbi:MAG: nucleotidyltransferase family protein [Polymorphobacter sp.]|uniref:nucleotidyltransferase family protein n=1 Tax=Polymorphobacter sp. TaxID=1909290 RepID=UPI003A8412B3